MQEPEKDAGKDDGRNGADYFPHRGKKKAAEIELLAERRNNRNHQKK